MSCFPLSDVGRTDKRKGTSEKPGLDLNPYLNFLLDLNSLELPAQRVSQLDASKNVSQFANNKKTSERSGSTAFKCVSTKSATSATKDIASRLDRLEIELSKIIKCVSRQPERTYNSIPTSTDDEEGVYQPAPQTFQRRRASSSCRFPIKAESRPSRVPEPRPSRFPYNPCAQKRELKRVPSSCSVGQNFKADRDLQSDVREPTAPQPEAISKLENDFKTEHALREKLEQDFAQAKSELEKLTDQLADSSEQKGHDKARIEELEEALSDERMKREKLEKSLDVHKKLSASLSAKFEVIQQREVQLQTSLTAKDATIACSAALQNENDCLKKEISRLEKLLSFRTPDVAADILKEEQIRLAVDEALKKAAGKFMKFHAEQTRRLEVMLQESQDTIEDIEHRHQQKSVEDLAKHKSACTLLESESVAARKLEAAQERRIDELVTLLRQSNTRNDEIVVEKNHEIEKLEKLTQSLRKECDKMHQLKNTVATLHAEKTSLTDMKQSMQVLEKRSLQFEKDKETLETQLGDIEGEKARLEGQVEQMDKELIGHKSQLQMETQRSESALEKLRKDLTLQTEAVNIKDKIIADLQDSVQKLKRTAVEVPQKTASAVPDAEYWKRRSREQEEVLERLESRKEELKEQLLRAESQLHESNKAHQIINAKWKDKTAQMLRLQTNLETQQARFEVREEELQQERDEAIRRVETVEAKLDEITSRSRDMRQSELVKLRNKYEQQLTKKEAAFACAEQHAQLMEEKVKELSTELMSQKKQLKGKFSRLGQFFRDFEDADCWS